jgi:hypothetical protein
MRDHCQLILVWLHNHKPVACRSSLTFLVASKATFRTTSLVLPFSAPLLPAALLLLPEDVVVFLAAPPLVTAVRALLSCSDSLWLSSMVPYTSDV